MRNLCIALFFLLFAVACKKDEPALKADLYPETPVSDASGSAINTFHQAVSFYQMFVYRFDPATNRWTNRIAGHFSTISASDPTALGFTNPYVAESGVPLFDMVRLYTTEIGSTNIKTARINADKVLQFFPDYPGAKTGIVKVITQDITITRSAGSTFKIGISGSGTYDENAKIIDLEIKFDESAIKGAGQTIVYKMSPVALTLN